MGDQRGSKRQKRNERERERDEVVPMYRAWVWAETNQPTEETSLAFNQLPLATATAAVVFAWLLDGTGGHLVFVNRSH